MNLFKLKQILKLNENPDWVLRAPDQQQAVEPEPAPEAPLPMKQGGMPSPVKAPPPAQPSKMSPASLKKAADSLLLGGEGQQGAAATSAIPGQEGSANTSLAQALKMSRLSRQSSQQAPGSIGYLTGGGQ